jgi:Beta-propeller repeat
MFTYLAFVVGKQRSLLMLLVLLLSSVGCNVSYDPSPNDLFIDPLGFTVSYTRQFGTAYNDDVTSLATHSNGQVYIAVNTTMPNGVADTAYVHRYDPSGIFLEPITPPFCCGYWYSYLRGITTDANGSFYIVGDASAYKTSYVYIIKYAADGTLAWFKKLSEAANTNGDPTRVRANTVATDARGNSYLMFTKSYYPYQFRSVYVRKYNVRGGLSWEKSVGSSSSCVFACPTMTVDSQGNVYTTMGSNFISKYDTKGNFLWSSEATPLGVYAYVHDVTTGADGYVYMVGVTQGNLEGINQGPFDAYLRKYDNNGQVLWTRQFGTSGSDWANAVTADVSGNIYVTGSTSGSLQTNFTNRGDYDVYIRKYDANGNALQTRQFGTSTFDKGSLITTDVSGNIYMAGSTLGRLQDTKKGALDVYLRSYTP